MKTQSANPKPATWVNETGPSIINDQQDAGIKTLISLVLMLLMLSCLHSPAFGQVSTWAVQKGNWSDANSWLGGVPNGPAAVAEIDNLLGLGQSQATLDMSPTVRDFTLGLNFIGLADPPQLLMNGNQTLTITTQGLVNGSIVAQGNNNTIDLAARVNGGLLGLVEAGTLEVKPNSKLTISKGVFGNYDPRTKILNGGSYKIEGTLEIDDLGAIATNLATIQLSGPAATLTGGLVVGNPLSTLSSNGTRKIKTGVLQLLGGANLSVTALTNWGDIRIGPGSSLSVATGYTSYAGNTVVDGELELPPGFQALISGTGSVSGGGFIGNNAVNKPTRVGNNGKVYVGKATRSTERRDGAGRSPSVAPLAPRPYKLTIGGDYEQTDSGVLVVNMAAEQYGQLAVNGTATLYGPLQVSLSDGVVPTPADEYIILTAQNGVVGSFSSVSVSNGGMFRINYYQNPDGFSAVTLSDYSAPQ